MGFLERKLVFASAVCPSWRKSTGNSSRPNRKVTSIPIDRYSVNSLNSPTRRVHHINLPFGQHIPSTFLDKVNKTRNTHRTHKAGATGWKGGKIKIKKRPFEKLRKRKSDQITRPTSEVLPSLINQKVPWPWHFLEVGECELASERPRRFALRFRVFYLFLWLRRQGTCGWVQRIKGRIYIRFIFLPRFLFFDTQTKEGTTSAPSVLEQRGQISTGYFGCVDAREICHCRQVGGHPLTLSKRKSATCRPSWSRSCSLKRKITNHIFLFLKSRSLSVRKHFPVFPPSVCLDVWL